MNKETLDDVISKYKNYILKQTQADSIETVNEFDNSYDVSEVEIDGYKFKIEIKQKTTL